MRRFVGEKTSRGRFRFIIYCKPAPSRGDSSSSCILNTHHPARLNPSPLGETGSSYILNTPPHVAIQVHDISYTSSSFGDPMFITYLKHAPSFGDSGSSYTSFAKPAPNFSRAAACGLQRDRRGSGPAGPETRGPGAKNKKELQKYALRFSCRHLGMRVRPVRLNRVQRLWSSRLKGLGKGIKPALQSVPDTAQSLG